MSLEFQFETFVDVYHSIFSEYLSSVIAKLPKENEKYRAMKEELSSLYDKYPKILDIFDMDKAEGLSAEECAGLVKALQLRNELTDMELQSVYFRGCYDGVGYLKKQEFCNGMIEERRRWCEADAVFNICNHKFVYYMRLHKCPCGGFSNRDMIQSEKRRCV